MFPFVESVIGVCIFHQHVTMFLHWLRVQCFIRLIIFYKNRISFHTCGRAVDKFQYLKCEPLSSLCSPLYQWKYIKHFHFKTTFSNDNSETYLKILGTSLECFCLQCSSYVTTSENYLMRRKDQSQFQFHK